MTDIGAFEQSLKTLDARWRKTPPVRVDWYKPPPRRTLPLLRYAVNPAKTLILKVVVLPAAADAPESISVALFDSAGSFLFDHVFRGATRVKDALRWLRDLFADDCVVEVAEKRGQWAGSRCGRKDGLASLGRFDFSPTYSRSWLGGHDMANSGTRTRRAPNSGTRTE